MDFAIQSDFAIITRAGSRIIPIVFLILKDDSRADLPTIQADSATIQADFPKLHALDVS